MASPESHTAAASPAVAPSPKARSIAVWDPVVRLFHWLVVAGFAVNMFAAEEGKLVHRWVGYAILAAIAVRLVWGFVGRPHARFSDFLPSPSRLLIYAQGAAGPA